jgi:membrane protease YdiL (CAAX protease family)
MVVILDIGLAISLGGPLLLLLAAKKFRFESLSLPSRLSLWLLALVALVLAAYSAGPWLLLIGVQPFGWVALLGAVVATIAILFGGGLLQLLLRSLGVTNAKAAESAQNILRLSFQYRVFVVVTGAVVEEILYRGYAIGIGQHVFGSLTVAVVASLIVFTVVHFRWGISHLVVVSWAALVMSLLFVLTNNVFACILAHFVVDAVGFLLQPAITARQQAQKAATVHEG